LREYLQKGFLFSEIQGGLNLSGMPFQGLKATFLDFSPIFCQPGGRKGPEDTIRLAVTLRAPARSHLTEFSTED